MVKKQIPMVKTLYSTCMQQDMPQFLIVFTNVQHRGNAQFWDVR